MIFPPPEPAEQAGPAGWLPQVNTNKNESLKIRQNPSRTLTIGPLAYVPNQICLSEHQAVQRNHKSVLWHSDSHSMTTTKST